MWTMRQFAGFGSAEQTNARFKYLLANGQDGLSVAFDMPTLMGQDSDVPTSRGEIGHCGVSVDSLGIELAALRLAAGVTQAVLAGRMGTTQGAIARAGSGRLSPRMEFVDRWARACGLPLTLVLGQTPKAPNAATRLAMTRAILVTSREAV